MSMATFMFAVCISQACSFGSDCGLRDRPSVVEIELKLMEREQWSPWKLIRL